MLVVVTNNENKQCEKVHLITIMIVNYMVVIKCSLFPYTFFALCKIQTLKIHIIYCLLKMS